MVFFTIVGFIVIFYYLIYLILLFMCDCDIALAFNELFGKKLGKLRGKVIWITGASSGIGEAMAYEAAKYNAKIVLSARRANELQRVKDSCLALNKTMQPQDILILPLDILDIENHSNALSAVTAHFGQLDILVNNAGRSQRALWENIELAVDKEMFDLNVFSVVSLSRLAVKYFQNKGKGQIVVTSSLAGVMGAPFSGSYTGSKHAIHGYFDCLRYEKLGMKIYVTLLCPGPVHSAFLAQSFTETQGQTYQNSTQSTDRRMSAERCAHLSLIAIVNRSNEAWIGLRPVVPFTYAIRYFPNIANWLAYALGPRYFQRLRDSRETLGPAQTL